ncbi:MAG: FG-GAP-like repeat-containing protein [Candidatus Poseidoniaceae archaeon]
MMQDTRINKKTLILVVLFLTPIFFVPQSFASGTTQVNTFAGGANSITVTSDGNNTSSLLQIDIERNVTFQDASFVVEGQSAADTPGSVWINSSTGDTIWTFSGVGYGDLAHQNSFQTGATFDTIQLNNSSSMPSPILLPKNATIQSSQANITYSPQIDGQYIPVGAVRHMMLGDSNGDNLTDAFVFSTTNSTTGVNTGFAVVESNQTTMQYNLTAWTSTCINSDQMRIADMNNDSHDDVVTFSAGSSMMCIHYYNTTTMAYDPSFSVNITSSPIDVQIADMNGDGFPDFITIHGYSGEGLVSLTLFNGSSDVVRQDDDIPIFRWNFGQGRTSMRSLRVDDFFDRNETVIIVSDAWNDATEVTYDAQTRQLNANIVKFRNLTEGSIAGDFDGDGDIDFLTPKETESVLVINNQTAWEQVILLDVLDTTNATVFDHNNDGSISLLTPNPQFGDGNSATIEGNIGIRSITATGLGTPSLSPLTPYSVPRDVQVADINQDGLMDQFVLAGETLQGVFIGAWHNVSLDTDVDGDDDLWAEGYSSTTIPHIGVLTIIDGNDVIRDTVSPYIPAYPGISDGYGIEMVTNLMSISSNSKGIANFTDLDIAYDIEFSVKTSTGTIGSLSNSLNQQMLPGSGSFTVTLPVETTKAGQFDAIYLSMNYTLGAPNLALPPTPLLSVQSLTETGVTIEWQALSEFGSDLQEFQVFRMSSTTSYDYTSPYEIVIGQNSFTDSNVDIGSTYGYIVRSIHSYGIVSNLSQALEVTIPNPSAPSAVTNVQLVDLDTETASAPLKVMWDASTDPGVVEYMIYVATSDLNASGLNNALTSSKAYSIGGVTYQAAATVSSSTTEAEISLTSEYADVSGTTSSESIQDGQQYWVAVAAIDTYDNATLPLPFAGPTTVFNNTYIDSQLELTVTSGPTSASENVLESNSQMLVSVYAHYLDDSQQNVAIENAQLEMTMTYGTDTLVLNGQSDSNGQWVVIDVDSLHDATIPQTLLDYSANPDGVVSIDVSMQAIEIVDTQPYSSATTSDSMGTAISVELEGPASPVDMDANDAIDINITLSAVDSANPAHQASLEGTTILWEAFNDSSQNASMSGSETISTGKIRIASSFENMSRIEFTVDPGSRIIFGTTTFTVSLNEYTVPTQNNETNETETEWVPTSIQSVTIACESATILTNQQAADDPIDCLVQNPNPFSVDVDISVTENPSLFKTSGTISIAANESATVSFVPKYEDPLWARQDDAGVENQFSIQLRTSSPDYELPGEPIVENDVVTWTADLFVEVVTTPDGEEKSSSNVVLFGGIGAAIFALAAVGFILYRKASADFEDESFYEEEDAFLEDDDEPVEIPQGKPLDEFEDKTISAEPEIIERPGDSLISEVTESNEDIPEDEPESEEEVEETEEDDGISVDEFGTEWYEDEVGQWWYREEGAEDWSEYNE